MDSHIKKQKTKRSGKVIRFFTVEIIDASSMPELYANSSNPYNQLSDEERMKDFNKNFGLFWVESCREANKDIYGNKLIATSNKNAIMIPIRK